MKEHKKIEGLKRKNYRKKLQDNPTDLTVDEKTKPINEDA